MAKTIQDKTTPVYLNGAIVGYVRRCDRSVTAAKIANARTARFARVAGRWAWIAFN